MALVPARATVHMISRCAPFGLSLRRSERIPSLPASLGLADPVSRERRIPSAATRLKTIPVHCGNLRNSMR